MNDSLVERCSPPPHTHTHNPGAARAPQLSDSLDHGPAGVRVSLEVCLEQRTAHGIVNTPAHELRAACLSTLPALVHPYSPARSYGSCAPA